MSQLHALIIQHHPQISEMTNGGWHTALSDTKNQLSASQWSVAKSSQWFKQSYNPKGDTFRQRRQTEHVHLLLFPPETLLKTSINHFKNVKGINPQRERVQERETGNLERRWMNSDSAGLTTLSFKPEQQKPRSHQGPPQSPRTAAPRPSGNRREGGKTGWAGVYLRRGRIPGSPPPL